MEIPSEKILFDFFSGKASPLQRRMIEEWLKQEGSEHLYYECLLKWETENPQYSVDTAQEPQWLNAVFETPQHGLSGVWTKAEPESAASKMTWWRKIAAGLLLVLAVCSAFLFRNALLYKTYQTAFAQTQTLYLSDGTEVLLNANSSLRVPRFAFSSDTREAWLTGEAFFRVSKKKNKQPFVVHTPLVAIEVLGTRFNVTNRHGKSEVVLEEGKVQLRSARHSHLKPVVMQPGEYVTVWPADTLLQKRKVVTLSYASWRNKRLIFEDKPLSEVARTLQDYYGISVRIKNPALARRKFTGTLPTNDLTIVLESLSTMYQLEVEKEKNLIILR